MNHKRNQAARTFRNESLQAVATIAKNEGCKIYTFESSSIFIDQIFIENQAGQVGSASRYFSGVQFSTCHKSKNGSGNGSGFGSLVDGEEFNAPENYKVCFMVAPRWARSSDLYKYTSFEDYLNKGLKILKYYEL